MEKFINGIIESFKIVMTILGIINNYPSVYISNINLIRYEKYYSIYFETENIFNKSILDLIEYGIEINIYFKINTYFEKTIIYSNNIKYNIKKIEGYYYINDKIINKSLLFGYFNKIELVVLEYIDKYKNKKLKTEIIIFMDSPSSSELLNLWGNLPKININYYVR